MQPNSRRDGSAPSGFIKKCGEVFGSSKASPQRRARNPKGVSALRSQFVNFFLVGLVQVPRHRSFWIFHICHLHDAKRVPPDRSAMGDISWVFRSQALKDRTTEPRRPQLGTGHIWSLTTYCVCFSICCLVSSQRLRDYYIVMSFFGY